MAIHTLRPKMFMPHFVDFNSCPEVHVGAFGCSSGGLSGVRPSPPGEVFFA